MKRSKAIISVLLAVLTLFCFAACGASSGKTADKNSGDRPSGSITPSEPEQSNPEQPEPDDKNILVAYFSCTDTTKGVAEKIAAAAGGELFRITPANSYTAADLNYNNDNSRANREQNDPSARPAISGAVENMPRYDAVFIGYPIWWGKLPKIIYTFLDAYDLSEKTVVPFCTSGGSGIAASAAEIRALEPNAAVLDGKRFAGGESAAAVQTWVNELELNIKEEADMIKVRCGNNVLDIELADNPSAKAFYEKLTQGEITVEMNDYGDFEKVGPLGFSLVRSDTQITTSPGDVILYLGNTVTIYYDTNRYNFTLLGKIKGMTRQSMLAFFGGTGKATVTFSLK